MTASSPQASASPTDRFFSDLASRGWEPLLKSTTGTIRFDLDDGDHVGHWYVSIDRGEVSVSHHRSRADAVVELDRVLFDGMVSGTVNAMAATLRGDLVPDGDLGLVVLFQRLFPGPPAPTMHHPELEHRVVA